MNIAALNGRNNPSHVTALLQRVNEGEADAFNSLIDAVYDELRRLATAVLRTCRGYDTLQPTALVHEAWLNLNGRDQQWDGRGHFFGAAARAMRQILVAEARQRSAQKRSGVRVTFRELQVACPEPDVDVLALEQALAALNRVDERLARVMELRYFCGLTLSEVSELESRSLATVKRDWVYARAWLYDFMTANHGGR